MLRRGKLSEAYVFNSGGQTIDLEDLVCGFRINETGNETPMLNPIKDSLQTKTTQDSHNLGTIVYLPQGFQDAKILMQEYKSRLAEISESCSECNIST